MSDKPEGTRWERLQERLDDALPAAERAALERELAADPLLAAEARELDALARLARRARVAAPAGFADRVMDAIAVGEGAAGEDAAESITSTAPPAHRMAATAVRRSSGAGSFWARLFGDADGATGWLRPGLAGALALAALAVAATLLFVKLESRAPEGGPAGELAAQETPAGGGTAPAEVVTHRFVLQAPDAQKVCLVGDFNQWKLCEVPMKKDAEGHWVADVQLPRGRHQYMFVVDDRKWQTDPRADVRVDDGFGNQNAVVFL